ncbi:MAG TPA: NUDIX domain-containing protein [Vicinamibacterales bacterium]|nr:NUDIX domain-containing protein [Vicinamibacterales bacterium]
MVDDPMLTHAGGVVFRGDADRRVLLVRAKPAPHDWVLPKGHIERGESPETTARREVVEEAGVEAEPVRHAGTLEFVTPNGKHVRSAFFLMRFIRHVPPQEQREIRWATIDEAKRLVQFDDTRALIESARGA